MAEINRYQSTVTDMELSEILNVVLGGGLVGALISIVTIRSALKKARAEADKAQADADTVKITNTEQATRILVENIVKPLTEELNETRKEMASIKREVARLRKTIDSANSCRYNADCPVLERMRLTSKEHQTEHGQRASPHSRQRKRICGDGEDNTTDCAEAGSDDEDSDRQPP